MTALIAPEPPAAQEPPAQEPPAAPEPRGRTTPQMRATAAAVLVLLAVVAAAAVWDPSGLLAPVAGRGLPLIGPGRWAPLFVGLPVLLAGTAYSVSRVRRWVFVGTWLSVIGAGALATAATAAVSAIPMIDAHLPAASAVTFALATSGFAAIKYAIVGLLVAAVTSLVRRGPKERAESRPIALPTAIIAVVVALAAVGPAAHWWRDSIGYAYDGFLIAPTAANGVLGYLTGTAVFLAAFAGAARRLNVYLASIAAGLALGAVQAVTPDAGSDSWWIARALVSVAAGIGYGAMVGLAGVILTRLVRLNARAVAAPAVVLVGLVPVVGASAPSGPEEFTAVAATGGMERLQLLPSSKPTEPAVIGDVTGRQVILRGVNVNQLIDYYLRDPSVPATQPLTDADFAQMAAMGFNTVRLGLSWSRLEPQRGVFDEAYLQRVRDAVAMAKAHDIYTVLDMHEDAWGNALARPSEKCGGGTTPTTGWDGAPAWATITDGTAYCQFLARDLAPAVATAFSNFYTDRDGVQTELVRTWAFVAQAFAGEPAVAGYDLLNEPGIGADPPVSSALLLGRYYDAAIRAIRSAERTRGGYAHLVFFEPSVLWSGLAFDVTPPAGFTEDRQIVFAPHPYSESISMDQSFGLTIATIERNLTVSARAAASYGAGLWTGEWG